jgi:hypothetical protein
VLTTSPVRDRDADRETDRPEARRRRRPRCRASSSQIPGDSTGVRSCLSTT